MAYSLRWYQQEALDAIYNYMRNSKGNPCVVLPTGSGKTPLLSQICADVVTLWGGRVCVLAHVKELLEQATDKLAHFLPAGSVSLPTVGLYSAGLGRRDTQNPVIVAGIQSVYRKAFKLCNPRAFDIVIVDEAHLIPSKDRGMYRKFLGDVQTANPKVRVVGLTATPYRLDTGLIYGGKDDIFIDLVYEANVKLLILQNFLSPLKTKRGCQHADMENVAVRCGEYVTAEMAAKFDEIMVAAVNEILHMTNEQSRRSVLIFCPDVKYGQKVTELIRNAGADCAFVCGDTPKEERDRILTDFKNGRTRYLANVNVLTTGFDAPNVDCVALLRSTLSPGLYYQMIGRGLRICEGKQDCLVLDYGENVATHGPIDMIRPPKGKQSDGESEAALKECPTCHEMVFAGYAKCPECGTEFAADTILHNHVASNKGVVSGEITTYDVTVNHVAYFLHHKKGFENDSSVPPTLRVEYRKGGMGDETFRQWICLDFRSNEWAVQKGQDWWRERSLVSPPDNIEQAVQFADAGVLRGVKRITVREEAGNNYPEIIGYEFEPMPTEEETDQCLRKLDMRLAELAEEAREIFASAESDWFDALGQPKGSDDIPF